MCSISFGDLATIVYTPVDDWYQVHGVPLLQGKRGAKPRFSDSEVITLLLMDFLPFPGERQFLGFVRAHYLPLFPRLLDPASSTAGPARCACSWKPCDKIGPHGWESP